MLVGDNEHIETEFKKIAECRTDINYLTLENLDEYHQLKKSKTKRDFAELIKDMNLTPICNALRLNLFQKMNILIRNINKKNIIL